MYSPLAGFRDSVPDGVSGQSPEKDSVKIINRIKITPTPKIKAKPIPRCPKIIGLTSAVLVSAERTRYKAATRKITYTLIIHVR